MRDVKFVLGECTKSNTKYYFQYNNKSYFIIEKSPIQEKVLDRITNTRIAYDKWRAIKAESDDKSRKIMHEDIAQEVKEKDYSYTTIVFEYESDLTINQKPSKDRLPKEKVKIEKISLDRDGKHEKKINQGRNDFEKDHFREDRKKNDKKIYKKNNTRFDKSNAYRRNEHKSDRQKSQ